jgi:ribose transport system permease protein
METGLLVDMVLVGYLSPVFSRRGTITPLGAFLGSVLVAVLSNTLILARIDNSWVYGVKGALILAVVVASALSARRPR